MKTGPENQKWEDAEAEMNEFLIIVVSCLFFNYQTLAENNGTAFEIVFCRGCFTRFFVMAIVNIQ